MGQIKNIKLHIVTDIKHKQFEQLMEAGFVHKAKRCSTPEIVTDGPILEVVKRFPESKSGANVITVSVDTNPVVPAKLSVGKMLHVDRTATVEDDEYSDASAMPRKKENGGSEGDITEGDINDDGSVTELKNIPNGAA